jgi:hypothetical protein
MQTAIVEVTQDRAHGFNWGKFCIARFDTEWERRSALPHNSSAPLLSQCGWGDDLLWVLDLQTGEGAYFRPGGNALADLWRHRIWVCPMFGPFLEWLYGQDLTDLSTLPAVVEIPGAVQDFRGRRYPGPEDAESGP